MATRLLVIIGSSAILLFIVLWTRAAVLLPAAMVTAHLISLLLHFAFGKPTSFLFQAPLNFGPPPQGVGFNLGVVYLSWIAGVLLLYPLCKWFAGVKARRKDWWLSYL